MVRNELCFEALDMSFLSLSIRADATADYGAQ
jgi:hypothetical protein